MLHSITAVLQGNFLVGYSPSGNKRIMIIASEAMKLLISSTERADFLLLPPELVPEEYQHAKPCYHYFSVLKAAGTN